MASSSEGQNQNSEIDWSLIWRIHGRWLRTVLLARLRDGFAVDEVFQEMALIVARKPNRWPAKDKVGPWLYRIAIRQVQMYRRRQHRIRVSNEGLTAAWEQPDLDAIDPSVWLVDRECESHVRTALHRIGDQDREMLLLRHTEHWTYRQIAQHLGITIDKVIYRLRRANQAIKAELASLSGEWSERPSKRVTR